MKHFITSGCILFFFCIICTNIEASQQDNLVVDLDNCTLGSKRVSFDRILHGKFNYSEKDTSFKAYLDKLYSQLSYILGVPTETTEWGIGWNDSNGDEMISTFTSSSNSDHVSAGFKLIAGNIRMTPNISRESSPEEIEAIFSKEIEEKVNINSGEQIGYNLLLCGKHKAQITVPTKKGLNTSKDHSEFFPTGIYVSLKGADSSAKSNNSSTRSASPTSHRNKFRVGDIAYVCEGTIFGENAMCKAEVLEVDRDRIKVTYLTKCTSIAGKGDIDWVKSGQAGTVREVRSGLKCNH